MAKIDVNYMTPEDCREILELFESEHVNEVVMEDGGRGIPISDNVFYWIAKLLKLNVVEDAERIVSMRDIQHLRSTGFDKHVREYLEEIEEKHLLAKRYVATNESVFLDMMVVE